MMLRFYNPVCAMSRFSDPVGTMSRFEDYMQHLLRRSMTKEPGQVMAGIRRRSRQL